MRRSRHIHKINVKMARDSCMSVISPNLCVFRLCLPICRGEPCSLQLLHLWSWQEYFHHVQYCSADCTSHFWPSVQWCLYSMTLIQWKMSVPHVKNFVISYMFFFQQFMPSVKLRQTTWKILWRSLEKIGQRSAHVSSVDSDFRSVPFVIICCAVCFPQW